jgi:putative membrane protein
MSTREALAGVVDRRASAREPLLLLACGVALLALSGIHPKDRLIWWLEVAPVLIVAPLLVASYGRFPLTPLLYRLVLVHAAILVLGAHYTYSGVPPGDWVRAVLGLTRNPYDRLGHLAQGFVPAIAAREILLRTSPLTRGAWLAVLVTCVCLAVSATYELVEWWVAVATGTAADAFLGTQGDPWDTQWDMLLATIGAIAAQLLLSRLHDRQLAALRGAAG